MVAIIIPGMGPSSELDEDGDEGGDPSTVWAQDDGAGWIGSEAPAAVGKSGIFELHGRLGRLADVAGTDRDVTSGLECCTRVVPVTELLRLRGLLDRWDTVEPNAVCNLCLRCRLNSSKGTPPRSSIAFEACAPANTSIRILGI